MTCGKKEKIHQQECGKFKKRRANYSNIKSADVKHVILTVLCRCMWQKKMMMMFYMKCIKIVRNVFRKNAPHNTYCCISDHIWWKLLLPGKHFNSFFTTFEFATFMRWTSCVITLKGSYLQLWKILPHTEQKNDVHLSLLFLPCCKINTQNVLRGENDCSFLW